MTRKTDRLVDRVAHVLTQARGRWIDGRQLAQAGGFYGWRSRVSNVRREYGLWIENRQRTVQVGRKRVRVSEYRAV